MAKDKLRIWQDKLARDQAAYESELQLMDERESYYRGTNAIKSLVPQDRARIKSTPHIRNICAEIIEAQVSSSIPQPKVTARRPQDEKKAKIIEDMLRNELDRLPMETINDMLERTVPIQGGAALLVEWDNTKRSHDTVGELAITALHPKQIIPQEGVYTSVEDMDRITLKIPTTKEYIRRKYGISVERESEAEPEIKSPDAPSGAEEMVTLYKAYYRNDSGGIGIYAWVGDTEIEDIEDYQARRLRRCAVCGAAEPVNSIPLAAPTLDGTRPGDEPSAEKGACPYCGSRKWEQANEDYEEIYVPVIRRDQSVIPGATTTMETELDENGNLVTVPVHTPTLVPYYKPDIYPVLLLKNVSVYGKFLGDSDIDKIKTQQNTTNRLHAKIVEKLMNSGSYMTLPRTAMLPVDERDGKVIRLDNISDREFIGVYDMAGPIEQDMTYLAQVYEESRQLIGITDSFQGRADRTATSGKAKEFAAAQSAGRLESKRVMKDAAYAALFEAMFKFKLAYTDEARPVVATDNHGDKTYEVFSRYDFLEQSADGTWYWNDQFLFSCDTSAPLANNREAMWQETRMNLQTGAYGDPAQLQTLILFWSKMDLLHYPGAADTKTYLEEELRRQQQAQQMQLQAQQLNMAAHQAASQEVERAVITQAQQDAARDMAAGSVTAPGGISGKEVTA